MPQVASYVSVGGTRYRQIPAGAASYFDTIVVGLKRSDTINRQIIFAGSQWLELEVSVSIRRGRILCIIGLSGGHYVRSGNRLSVGKSGSLRYTAAHNTVITDRLQSAQSLDLLLSVSHGTAVIAVVIEDDGFASFLAQEKKPAVAYSQLRETQPLRCEYSEWSWWIAMENLFRCDLDSLFVFVGGNDG
jgi:hypothetical protein